MKAQSELRALTLWRPWPHAIFYGGKRIENRSWKPPLYAIDNFIAIHAGLKYDDDGATEMIESGLYVPPEDKWCPKGAIVGVARVTGYVQFDEQFFDCVGPEFQNEQFDWFTGPFGWKLDDVVPFNKPVKAKGMQGLWFVEGDVKDAVREAHRAALKEA